MSYSAIVTKLVNVRKHPNADRLMLATCLGNQVVVGLNAEEGMLGVYFPTDGRLGLEFAQANDLIRRRNPETGAREGGMFDQNCRIRAQKFRGEMSDGFWCPIGHLLQWKPNTDVNELIDGKEINTLNGDILCMKYMTPKTMKAMKQRAMGPKKAKSLMFKEHFETSQFYKHYKEIQPGSLIIITEKCHGTSQRFGLCLVERELTWKDKIARFFGVEVKETEWRELNGTRRVILTLKDKSFVESGFYTQHFREIVVTQLRGAPRKGETLYFEVVGFESPKSETTIMPVVDPKKVDKEFAKRYSNYGNKMAYLYGNKPGEHDIFIYRITQTNEDGITTELPWFDVCKRCRELGVATVPVLLDPFVYCDKHHWINTPEELLEQAKKLASGPSILDSTHIREGVVVRVEGYMGMNAYKLKSDEFKILESISKDTDQVDLEEIS